MKRGKSGLDPANEHASGFRPPVGGRCGQAGENGRGFLDQAAGHGAREATIPPPPSGEGGVVTSLRRAKSIRPSYGTEENYACCGVKPLGSRADASL